MTTAMPVSRAGVGRAWGHGPAGPDEGSGRIQVRQDPDSDRDGRGCPRLGHSGRRGGHQLFVPSDDRGKRITTL
eukprot:scaffold215538_cov18-Prasinocladus_malaysianus.AAC.1